MPQFEVSLTENPSGIFYDCKLDTSFEFVPIQHLTSEARVVSGNLANEQKPSCLTKV